MSWQDQFNDLNGIVFHHQWWITKAQTLMHRDPMGKIYQSSVKVERFSPLVTFGGFIFNIFWSFKKGSLQGLEEEFLHSKWQTYSKLRFLKRLRNNFHGLVPNPLGRRVGHSVHQWLHWSRRWSFPTAGRSHHDRFLRDGEWESLRWYGASNANQKGYRRC